MMINYPGLWKLRTKPIVYQNVLSAGDLGTLEQLKELSAKRKAIEESINGSSSVTEAIAREMSGGLTSRYERDIQKLEYYLPLLENLTRFIDLYGKSSRVTPSTFDFEIRWSSVLSPPSFLKSNPEFYEIPKMRFELGMTLYLYAALIRERALEVLSSNLVQSATLLRNAAGVYNYLAEKVLVKLHWNDTRPAEARPCVCNIMSLICLAEAQAVAARKAEENGNTEGLLAKLHFGVRDILVEAINIVQSPNRNIDISSRFLEFLLSCKMLHELTSYKYLAKGLENDGKIWIAIGVLRCALANAKKNVPREESWRSVSKQKIDELTMLLQKYERENEFVWHEKIPSSDHLPSPQAVRIVDRIPYQLPKSEKALILKY